MISIKNKGTKPQILSDKSKIIKNLNKLIDDDIYGKGIKSKYNDTEVKKTISELTFDKCAYCEGTKSEGFSVRIDHYRPKDKVETIQRTANGNIKYDKNDKAIRVNVLNDTTQLQHKGYYWLGFEWTNLLPSCERCNGNKSNLFPLDDETQRLSDDIDKEGFRKNGKYLFDKFQATSAIFKKEKRLLLNPELDNVEEHFIFLPNGTIYSETPEGKMSIEVYGLNRSTLIIARKKVIDDLILELLDAISQEDDYKVLIKRFFRVNMKYNNKSEYALLRYYIDNFFDAFILEPFKKLVQ